MTAIGDKLKQAGVDTLGVEFYARAIEALKANKSIRDAWRGLGERWGHAVLTRIWSDMQGPAKEQAKSGDHLHIDIPWTDVSHEGASGGQLVRDTPKTPAAARLTSQPKPAKPFFKQKGADEKTKLIIRQAALTGSSIWRDLKMDRLRVHELDGFIRDQIVAGGNHALKAHWETKRAAVAWQIKQHATFTDENALVKDCVSDKLMARYVANADRQASLIVAKIVQQTAKEIDRGVKLIAAE